MQRIQAVSTDPSDTLRVSDFDDCRNVEKGAVFIVASGASAKDFPIARFSQIPMITMNGAISMFIGTGIKPCFYACTDRSFSLQQPDLFAQAMALSQRVALWEDHVRSSTVRPAGELYLLSKAPKPSWSDFFFSKDKELVRGRAIKGAKNKSIGFSKNLKRGFFDARTVAYLAVQIAYHLGFSKVFLVGVDLNQSAPRFYEGNRTALSPCGLEQHLTSRILPSFKLMADEVMGREFSVYNLSAASRIPDSVVPYKSLAEVEAMIHEQ